MRVMAEAKQALGEDIDLPEVNEAFTMAPAWQERRVGPQLIMACVAVPVCKTHLEVNELSPVEQAIRNGKIMPGMLGPNG
jgi:hypothetical protein